MILMKVDNPGKQSDVIGAIMGFFLQNLYMNVNQELLFLFLGAGKALSWQI